MAITRPRGAMVNPERRQKPLHPHHRKAQEAVLTDGTFKNSKVTDEKKTEEPEKKSTPIPQVPPNNLTSNADQVSPADGTQSNNPSMPNKTNTLAQPKANPA